MTLSIRSSRPAETDLIVDIWRHAVDATHYFLTPADRIAIETEVRAAFPSIEFAVACDARDVPIGFMLLDGAHLEALFIAPSHHGQGVGRALLQTAMAQHDVITTDVNEHNGQALGFYERLGFRVTGRSDLDGQGRPYPLLKLCR